MPLLCPPSLENKSQKKLGLESAYLKPQELKFQASRLALGSETPTVRRIESWSMLPTGSKERLTEAIGRIFSPRAKTHHQSATEQIERVLVDGFLRIHMDIEKQPVETFLLRIHRLTINKASTAWNSLRRMPATSTKPKNKGGGAKT